MQSGSACVARTPTLFQRSASARSVRIVATMSELLQNSAQSIANCARMFNNVQELPSLGDTVSSKTPLGDLSELASQMNSQDIEFEFTLDDYLAFYRFHHYRSPALRGRWLRARILVILVTGALPAMVLVTADNPLVETAMSIWPLLFAPVIASPESRSPPTTRTSISLRFRHSSYRRVLSIPLKRSPDSWIKSPINRGVRSSRANRPSAGRPTRHGRSTESPSLFRDDC